MVTWRQVETAIFNEICFLRDNIITSPYRQNDPINCHDCLYRSIAILIVSGKVQAIKYNALISLNTEAKISSSEKPHGKDWHNNKIHELKTYFEQYGYDTVTESNLFFGRCDLGLPGNNTYIEIGSVNLYKLYVNLSNMKNCALLCIPDDKQAILFKL